MYFIFMLAVALGIGLALVVIATIIYLIVEAIDEYKQDRAAGLIK